MQTLRSLMLLFGYCEIRRKNFLLSIGSSAFLNNICSSIYKIITITLPTAT